MQVSKWGNSLAIRIPAKVAEVLSLREGDNVNIRVAGARDFVIERDMSRAQAVERLALMAEKLPEGWRFDRQEANER